MTSFEDVLKSSWQEQLKSTISSMDELESILQIPPNAFRLPPHFPLKITHSYVKRIEKNNPNDPLLLQILPQIAEKELYPGYSHDPLQEEEALASTGLLHKYHGRALITLSGACAIHCRYCFRQHYPYREQTFSIKHWRQTIQYLERHPEINEIILSGGDPLVVNDTFLEKLISVLNQQTNIERIRIHSRLPIVLPSRITPSLIETLGAARAKIIMVVHCNHAQEINDEVRSACQRMTAAGWLLLNQSVLLRDINDSIKALVRLSETLFKAGILPYYCHLLDATSGTHHFAVPLSKIRQLADMMRAQLPGYLVPKFVKEEPGKGYKTPLDLL